MVPLRDFLSLKTSIYYKSWAVIPWQVISWGLTQVGLVNGAPREANLSGGQFVLLGNVEVSTAQALIFGPGCIACADPDRRVQKECYSWSPLEPIG